MYVPITRISSIFQYLYKTHNVQTFKFSVNGNIVSKCKIY